MSIGSFLAVVKKVEFFGNGCHRVWLVVEHQGRQPACELRQVPDVNGGVLGFGNQAEALGYCHKSWFDISCSAKPSGSFHH